MITLGMPNAISPFLRHFVCTTRQSKLHDPSNPCSSTLRCTGAVFGGCHRRFTGARWELSSADLLSVVPTACAAVEGTERLSMFSYKIR